MHVNSRKIGVMALLCGALLLAGCGGNGQRQNARAAWGKDFDAVAQQFQLIRQAHAQESGAMTPPAQATFQNMQQLWQQMQGVESKMMRNSGTGRGGMMGGHRGGNGMMRGGRMGAGMMGGPAMMRFNEMNQQMLSYCMGMQQMMQRAGNADMAAMYGRMAGGMKSVLSALPAGSAAAPAAPQPQPGAAAASDGSAVYAANCASCHGAAGAGMSGVFPPLSGSPIASGDPEVAEKIVLHGLQGQVTVGGVQYNGFMPAFGGTLTDQQIAAALSYMRSLPGNNAAPVSADAVSSVRKETASHAQPWTPQELGMSRQ